MNSTKQLHFQPSNKEAEAEIHSCAEGKGQKLNVLVKTCYLGENTSGIVIDTRLSPAYTFIARLNSSFLRRAEMAGWGGNPIGFHLAAD